MTAATAPKSIKHRNADAYDPRELLIAGHDTPPDPADPLYDPDRVALLSRPRSRNNIDSIKAGVPVPAVIGVKRMHEGRERIFVKEGRQRVFDGRLAAHELEAKGESPPAFAVIVHNGMTDDDHAIGVGSYNNLGYRETVMTKVRRAAWLNARCAGKLDIIQRALNLKSANAVRGYLRLADAAPALHEAVDAGIISATAASVLAMIEDREGQVAAMNNVVSSGAKSVADCRAFVAALGLEDSEYDDADPTDEDEADEAQDAPPASSSEPAKGPPKPKPKAKEKGPDEDLRGRPPKRTMVRKVVERALAASSKDDADPGVVGELDVAIKVMRWLTKGEAPPKCIASYVRSEKDAAKKRADAKAAK